MATYVLCASCCTASETALQAEFHSYSNPIPIFTTSNRVAMLTTADTTRMAMTTANSRRSISSSVVGVPRIRSTAHVVDREVLLQLRLNCPNLRGAACLGD